MTCTPNLNRPARTRTGIATREKGYCAWVAIKPEERCELTAEGSKVTAYEGCPLTCGKCHSSRRLELEFSMFEPDDMYPEPEPSCEDTDWNRNSEKGRDCAWVAIKPEERCELTAEGSKVTAYEGCPLTCGRCA